MHALIALGASHLTRVSPQRDYSTMAIIRRGQAIKGLNDALAQANCSYGESDALLAACYALTFQASYMGDGMADFITMIRGCALVTTQIKESRSLTAFTLGPDMHLRVMEPRLSSLPQLDPTFLIPAIPSTQALLPFLSTPTDHAFHTGLLSVLHSLLHESPQAGYLAFMSLYGTFPDMSHDQFNVFIDGANVASQLLMAHFVALQLLMVPLTLRESPERADPAKSRVLLGMVEWGERIVRRAQEDVRAYLEWPGRIVGLVRREVEVLQEGVICGIKLRILSP